MHKHELRAPLYWVETVVAQMIIENIYSRSRFFKDGLRFIKQQDNI